MDIVSFGWTIALGAAVIYCVARGVSDLRNGRFIWGVIGLLSGFVLLTMPIQTHAVKINLPMAKGR